jgi:CheY-like chemotaxis protein
MDKAAVLLLERNATIIDVARACFAEDDVELHVANSVDLAVRIASRRALLVAVLDATMAGSTPGETVMKLKAFHPALRIVFIADPAVNVDRRYSQLGFVLRKPFTVERFGDTVRSALRLQSMSAGVQRMRHSSGTYTAVHGVDSLSGGLPVPFSTTPPAGIPAVGSSPPPGIGAGHGHVDLRNDDDAAGGPMLRRSRDRKAPIPREEPPSEPPRTVTPRPFARVR